MTPKGFRNKEEQVATESFSRFTGRILAVLATLLMLAGEAYAASERVIYSFTGGADGGYPDSDLVMDRAGNLYGTTVEGGLGSGTVFKLTQSGNAWTETVLYAFKGGEGGAQPYGGVTLDLQGNIYGTTVVGGLSIGPCVDSGCGVVFKLTNCGGIWTEAVIHSFTGGHDGYGPGAGLTFDRHGNLYGMTPTGGANGLGVVYQLKPGANGTWQESVIHAFTGDDDGASASAGRLILDTAGNLYGVATTGGANDDGTAFELRPTPSGWRFKTLYAFEGDPYPGYPYGALAFDSSGNLYGTTYYGGANDLGSVYELSPAGGLWTETVLYSFKGGTDGSSPISNVVFDDKGNVYGTTSEGGAGQCSCGTVFKLTRGSSGTWTETVVHSFKGAPDGGFVYNGMIRGPAESFFGTTVHGGIYNEGSVYQFAP